MGIFDKLSKLKSDAKNETAAEVVKGSAAEPINADPVTEKTKTQQLAENLKKGTDFENYALSLFPEKHFSMIQRAIAYDPITGRRLEGCLDPDFKMRDKQTDEMFYVECKYRSHPSPDRSISWCTYEKMQKYKDIRTRSNLKVYVLLGVGGSPENPDDLYCFDLDDIKYNKLYQSLYTKLSIDKKPFFSLDHLHRRVNHSL